MAMLKKRKMVQYLIHHLPFTVGRQLKSDESVDGLMGEMKYLYGKLGIYDRIIDHIGKVGI